MHVGELKERDRDGEEKEEEAGGRRCQRGPGKRKGPRHEGGQGLQEQARCVVRIGGGRTAVGAPLVEREAERTEVRRKRPSQCPVGSKRGDNEGWTGGREKGEKGG